MVKSYSGGMRRRLDLAVSLLASPPVLFLDEPTTGLDPRSRSDLWEVLRGLVAEGTTLLLTTQYLEEADQLADDIVVIDQGRIIARGLPAGAQTAGGQRQPGGDGFARRGPGGRARELLAKTGADVSVDSGCPAADRCRRRPRRHDRGRGLAADATIDVDDIGLSRPSLDDVFLSLTGHRADDRGGRRMTVDCTSNRTSTSAPADASGPRTSHSSRGSW